MSVLDGLKKAAAALRAADKIPEYNAILDAQQKIFDLQTENQEHKETQKELESLLKKKEHVKYHSGAMWERLAEGEYKGPCCPARCWEADHRTIPLTRVNQGRIKWVCPCCNGKFAGNIPDKYAGPIGSGKPKAPQVTNES